MITFLDFTKFAWEHRSTSIKLEDLYVNPGKSYIYILVPQSDIKKMLNGEDFYGKVGVTKNEPYNRFKDIDKQLVATATGKPEYAYCLCVFEIDFKDQADKAVHAVLEKLGCIKSKDDVQYSTSTFGEKPGDDWFINLSFNKIIKSIDTVYKNNKKYFVSDDININGVINYKMPEVYNNNTIIRKMIENIKSDKDDNIVELIYVGFVMSYIKYKNNELSGKTFNEIIDSTILSEKVDEIINSIKSDNIFKDNIAIKNIITKDLYSKYAELYNKITSIYNNVSNSVTSRLNTLLSGLNKDIFNTDITTFITLLYTDFKFKQYVNKLNIKYTSKIMEYRMTFDLFEYIINEMSRSYNGPKDANFYKTVINNITIFVDSNFMAEMWRTLIHSEYGIYNIIDSINIVNISSSVEKLKNYMEENKKKFDVCLMNPPYDETTSGDQFYVKFINEVLKISYKAIIISPHIGFLSKSNNNKSKLLKYNINTFKPELIITNWEKFDVKPNSKCCISIWDIKNPNNKIKVGNTYFDSQNDIILDDNKYLHDFYIKLVNYLKYNNSIYDMCIANPKNSQYYDPNGINKIKNIWDDKDTWFTVFPYCISTHFSAFDVKKYSDELWYGPARILLPFKNKLHAENCYKTIHKNTKKRGELTDFYSLISNALPANFYIHSPEKYKYFPYLDFSKSYTDEYLFKMIGMEYNKNEIDKILINL